MTDTVLFWILDCPTLLFVFILREQRKFIDISIFLLLKRFHVSQSLILIQIKMNYWILKKGFMYLTVPWYNC